MLRVTVLRGYVPQIHCPMPPAPLPPVDPSKVSSIKAKIVSYCEKRLYTAAHLMVNNLFQCKVPLADYYHWRGIVYEKEGDIKFALRSVEIALILQPTNPHLLNQLDRLLPLLPR